MSNPSQRRRPLPRSALGAAGLAILLLLPRLSEAAAGLEHPKFGPLLFTVAGLVLAAKVGGLIAERFGQPAVLGELVAGICLGNLTFVIAGADPFAEARSDQTLAFLAQAGVLILLFDVGLETNLKALLRVGWSAILAAAIGVVTPIVLGGLASAWLLPHKPALVHIFVGAALSATSVGITARVLQDLQATQRPEGQIILGAAILDDILGLVVLAVVGGMATAAATGGSGVSLVMVLGIVVQAAVFLVAAAAFGHFLSAPLARWAGRTGRPDETLLVFGLALCFCFAFLSERIGLADIIGAFAAGVFIDPYGRGIRTHDEADTLRRLLHPLSSVFVPLFFVLMGMRVSLEGLPLGSVLLLAGALTLCAVLSKLVCGLGVLTPGTSRLAVGIGMVPRGEVGLIFAGVGAGLTLGGEPVLSRSIFTAIVLVVLVTTLLAPVGLRLVLDPAAPSPDGERSAEPGRATTP
jgi:Kef-type K+ transport system membrane component KefB